MASGIAGLRSINASMCSIPVGGRGVIGMDKPHAWESLGELTGQAAKRRVGKQDAGITIDERILDFPSAPTDVHWYDHRAGPRDGKVGLKIAVGVQRQDRNPTARPGAQCA